MLNENSSLGTEYVRANQSHVSSTLTLLICERINAAVPDVCA